MIDNCNEYLIVILSEFFCSINYMIIDSCAEKFMAVHKRKDYSYSIIAIFFIYDHFHQIFLESSPPTSEVWPFQYSIRQL